MIKKTLTILSILIFVVGCAKDDSSSDTSSSSYFVGLEGTWLTTCLSTSSEYLMMQVEVSGSNVTETYKYYSNSSCSSSNEILNIVTKYSDLETLTEYAFPGLGSDWKGHSFKIKVNSTTAVPLSSAMASSLNSSSTCGLTNWSVNVETNVSGKICGSTTYYQTNTLGYNIYATNGSNAYLGTFSTTSAPDTVTTNILWVKQ